LYQTSSSIPKLMILVAKVAMKLSPKRKSWQAYMI